MTTSVRSSFAKFLIGAFAASCAVFVPRLVSVLVVDDIAKISVLPMVFVSLGIVFAIIVGVIVTILEFDKIRSPSDTFMTALGVPALLAGALATSANTNHIGELASNNVALAEVARVGADIKKSDVPLNSVTPITPPASSPGGLLEDIIGIRPAYAQDSSSASKKGWGNWATVQVDEPNYAIVLDKAPTSDQALELAQKLKPRVPSAQAVKTSQGYRVISGIKPESSAVLEAINIKKMTGLTPELVRMQ